ncbi:MAG: glycoside hydrolase N-terminal domain-containing protein, partial [Candidatus Cloacimonetes bacterium]|nr:glycoside hydrolase N-terminal domain-containing protein [Candidatus Cloacimonadota bacterium]
MKRALILIINVFLISFISTTVAGQELKEELKLWFKKPATTWNEALPVGNGRLGAMVFGGIEHERLQLNEESLWTKGGKLEDKENGHEAIPEIRELLFEGEYKKAEQMCKKELMSERLPSGTNTYQT